MRDDAMGWKISPIMLVWSFLLQQNPFFYDNVQKR